MFEELSGHVTQSTKCDWLRLGNHKSKKPLLMSICYLYTHSVTSVTSEGYTVGQFRAPSVVEVCVAVTALVCTSRLGGNLSENL